MNQSRTRIKKFFDYLPYLIFFLISFSFFAFFADHIFFYQEKSSLFVFTKQYLIENLRQPGGFLIYLGKFITSFYYFPVIGALIVSVVICLIMFYVSKILKQLTGNEAIFLPLLVGVAFYFLQTTFQYELYNSIGVLMQLVFFYLSLKYLKGWIPILLSPAWYFLMGGFVWIFWFMYTISLVLKGLKTEWIKIISFWCLNFLLIYVLSEYVLFRSIGTLIIYPLSNELAGMQFKFFHALLIALILIPLLSAIKFRFYDQRISGMVQALLPAAIVVVLLTGISLNRFDSKTQQYFYIERLFFQNKLDKIIECNTKEPSNNLLTSYINNIALCESGKLTDQFFKFTQSPDGQTLFLKWEMLGEILRQGGYFYYTIGMINEAHRWAYENMVMKGSTPEDLLMLVKTEIINENYLMASKYIGILKKSIFYRKEAKEFEKLLFNDHAVNVHAELGEKKRNRIKSDFFAISNDPYANIEHILASDSLNRNAFEYKLAFLLLTKDYEHLIKELPKLERYGYEKIPVYVEEAVLAYIMSNKIPLPSLGKLHIDSRTLLRMNQFNEAFKLYGNDLRAAQPYIRKKFGGTFWYHALYR